MKVFFASFLRKTGYALAIIIIIIALMVALSRILTPILDKHRADFEKYASKLLETPVKIEKVRVSWYQYEPEISFNHVTILNQQTQEPLLQVEKIRIFFSIPQCLWQRKLIPSGIMLSGTDVTVHQSATGEMDVQGFPLAGFNAQPYKREAKFADATRWLSQQPRLVLRDVDVRYTGFNGQKRYVTLFDLSFKNSGAEHFIYGKAVLHQDIPTEITIAAQWLGKEIDLAKIKAKIYIYVSGLSLSQWLKGSTWNGWQINQGIISTKLWVTWRQGELRKIQSTFQMYGLNLYSQTDKSTHKIQRLSGNLGWKRDGKGHVFAGDDILIDLPEHLWPVTNFYIALTPDAQGVLMPKAANLGYVDANDLQSFLFSSPILMSDSAKNIITQLKPSGALQNATVAFSGAWNDWSRISASANFSHLTFKPWQQLPGVDNLSGTLKWNGSQGELMLHSNQAEFRYDALFAKPIPVQQLTGEVQWQLNQDNVWVLTIPGLHILNNDLSMNINGTLGFPEKASVQTDLKVNFAMQKLSHISRYLPMRAFDPDLVEWLQEAFLSGELQSGNVVLQGPLSDAPFDKGNGIFKASMTVHNLDLRYAPEWPVLKQVNAIITFAGRRAMVDVNHGQILDIPISGLQAVIPYLGDAEPQILHVDMNDIKTDLSKGMAVVHASPLEKTIGKMFAGSKLSGPMLLKVGMVMPLKNPDLTKVKGDLYLYDAQMNLLPWNLILDKLNGQLHFTENSTDSKNLQAVIFNKPLTLNIATVKKAKDIPVVRTKIATNFNINDLETWLKVPFSKVVNGATDVTGELDFSYKLPAEIHLRSDLVGVSVNLLDPYGKKVNEKRDFSADITMEEKHPLKMQLVYDDLLSAALVMDRNEDKFNLIGADVRFGNGSATMPALPGLYITGNFDELDWNKIKDNLSVSGENKFGDLQLRNVDINVNSMNILGQRLTKARIQVTTIHNNWNVTVTSPQVAGQIQVPVNLSPQSVINAQFQRLSLSAVEDEDESIINVKSLPALSILANNVSYNNTPLGQVILKTSPSQNGLNIKTLQVASTRMNLQATGDWIQSGEKYTSHLQGNAASSNVSNLLSSFGYDIHNFVASDGSVKFNFTWPDAPYAPSSLILNGRATLDLGRGRIVSAGHASGAKMDIGRLLSIFSLQSLPRRLSLDFSDITESGYSFDTLRGDFTFQSGDLYTTNAVFDGSLARVNVIGRIGLKNKDFDFTLSVLPMSITSSLPLAATLITGPVGGLAALAVNTVLSPALSKATAYYYVVRGPWSNPSWKEISVPQKKSTGARNSSRQSALH